MDDQPRSDQTSADIQPEVEARVRDSFARQGLMRLLGAELVEVTPGRVRIDLARRSEVSQQHGYVHAGATSAIADSAGGYAALTLMPANSEVLTVEYKLNLLAPAAGSRLEAIGTVLKFGRTLSVCRLEVYTVNDDADQPPTLVAAGQQTLISIPVQDAS